MIKAKGQLRHRFHGSYSAVVALVFSNPTEAARASAVLGTLWSVGTQPNVLVGVFDSDQLKVEKERLGRYGADTRKIDSIAKSIDYGEPFECTFPLAPVEQLELV